MPKTYVPPSLTSSGTITVTNSSSGAGVTLSDLGWNHSTAAIMQPLSGRLKLEGAEADIEINGKSLLKTLEAISERLNLLQVNPELEKDWEELRALGKQYRDLEQHILEKMQTWKILNK